MALSSGLFVLFVHLTISFYQINGGIDTIWADDMRSDTSWSCTGGGDTCGIWNGDICPGSTRPCLYVSVNNGESNTLTYSHLINVNGYTDLTFSILVNGYGLDSTGYCRIWYKYDGDTWNQLGDNILNGKQVISRS